MEQTSNHSKKLLEKLLKSKVKRVINIEPIIENYDDNSINDFTIKYHQKKLFNYWYTQLKRYEKIKIIFDKRFKFGDRYHEAYSIIVWETL